MRHVLFGTTQSSHIQFFRYFFVGGSAAVVDLAVFTALVTVFNLHYAVAAFVGYMLGLAWNHLLSVVWVFHGSKHERSKELFIVFWIAVGGLLWTWLLLYLLIDVFGMHEVIAKMISQILVLVWNFGMRKIYVFH